MTNDTVSLSWLVPCDQDLSFSVTIGSNTFRLRKEQLISSDPTGTTCTSLLKGWADPTVHSYLFGAPFAASAYIAYNAQRNASIDQIGLAPRTTNGVTIINNPGVSTGVLVGAIVGSVLGVALIAAALIFFLHRRRPGPDTPSPLDRNPSVKEQHTIEPFTDAAPPNSATPMISSSSRQSGWIIEQGPIGGESDEGSALETGTLLNNPYPRDVKGRRSVPSSHLALVRQSQITDSSSFSHSTAPSPRRDIHSVPRQSLYGERVPGTPIPSDSQSEPQQHDIPEIAPPPYQPNTTATTVASSSPPQRSQKQ